MNIIIDKKEFLTNKISLTQYFKIIYDFKNVDLLGIPLLAKNYSFTYNHNKSIINIKFNDKLLINIFNDIDKYFSKKFKKYKNCLINNTIQVKNINHKNIDEIDELYININSLKTKDFILYLNIFTL